MIEKVGWFFMVCLWFWPITLPAAIVIGLLLLAVGYLTQFGGFAI